MRLKRSFNGEHVGLIVIKELAEVERNERIHIAMVLALQPSTNIR